MLLDDRADGGPAPAAIADVVNVGAEEVPGTGSGLLPQGEHVQLVTRGQTLDERKESRNDPELSASIDAPRNDQRKLHVG